MIFLAAGKAREPNKLFTHFDFLRVPWTFSMRGPLECFSGLTRSFFGFIARWPWQGISVAPQPGDIFGFIARSADSGCFEPFQFCTEGV